MLNKEELKQALLRTLIVSSQAADNEPLNSPEHLFALAQSAVDGGARAMRLEGERNIAYARSRTELPIIGLIKSPEPQGKEERLGCVYITASFAEAKLVAAAGADIIAIDATSRPRPDGLSLSELIEKIHKELGKAVWADISTFEEGINAAACAADFVSTTLYGYTQESRQSAEAPPDFQLLERLCRKLSSPVVLEGRVWHPEELRRGFELGAHAVVVGSAITRPQLISKRFVKAIPLAESGVKTS